MRNALIIFIFLLTVVSCSQEPISVDFDVSGNCFLEDDVVVRNYKTIIDEILDSENKQFSNDYIKYALPRNREELKMFYVACNSPFSKSNMQAFELQCFRGGLQDDPEVLLRLLNMYNNIEPDELLDLVVEENEDVYGEWAEGYTYAIWDELENHPLIYLMALPNIKDPYYLEKDFGLKFVKFPGR